MVSRHVKLAVFALLLALIAPWPAVAASFRVVEPRGGGPVEIVLRGKIDIDDAYRFTRLVLKLRRSGKAVGVVALNSPGGYVREGLAIAALVRRERFDTFVTRLCASSCFNVFAAGATRLAARDASIGVHMAFTPAGTSRAGTEAMAHYARECGTPQRVIDKMLATRAPDIAWLDPADMTAMKVQMMP